MRLSQFYFKLLYYAPTAFVSGKESKEKRREEKKKCQRKERCNEVKVTLVQALRLCTGRTAHRGSRGMALPVLDHGPKRG